MVNTADQTIISTSRSEQSRGSPELEIPISRALPVRPPAPAPVLDGDAEDVEEALEHVAREPDAERHGGPLGRRGGEDGRGDGDEGEVPEHVEHDDGLGVGPSQSSAPRGARRPSPAPPRRAPASGDGSPCGG